MGAYNAARESLTNGRNAAVQLRYQPGEKIELPISEIRRLRALGFLVEGRRRLEAAAYSRIA